MGILVLEGMLAQGDGLVLRENAKLTTYMYGFSFIAKQAQVHVHASHY